MREFTTKSGAAARIDVAPWQDARRLKSAVEREAAAAGIKFDLDVDASTLLAAVLSIDSSEAVDAALWPCLARCTLDGHKIIPTTFDKAEARADYYEVVIACLTENFRPLVESLLSQFPDLLAKAAPKSASDPGQK